MAAGSDLSSAQKVSYMEIFDIFEKSLDFFFFLTYKASCDTILY